MSARNRRRHAKTSRRSAPGARGVKCKAALRTQPFRPLKEFRKKNRFCMRDTQKKSGYLKERIQAVWASGHLKARQKHSRQRAPENPSQVVVIPTKWFASRVSSFPVVQGGQGQQRELVLEGGKRRHEEHSSPSLPAGWSSIVHLVIRFQRAVSRKHGQLRS